MEGLIKLIIYILLPLVILAAVLRGIEGLKNKESKSPYIKKKYFLTKAEKDFFDVLEGIIRNKYYIFPQINISKLFLIEKGNNYYKHYNRINRKSVDFVLVDKNSLTPLLAIELDDSSHNRQDRMDRDNFVDDIFKNAEIPLLRIKCSREYNIQDISNLIYGNIQTKNS